MIRSHLHQAPQVINKYVFQQAIVEQLVATQLVDIKEDQFIAYKPTSNRFYPEMLSSNHFFR